MTACAQPLAMSIIEKRLLWACQHGKKEAALYIIVNNQLPRHNLVNIVYSFWNSTPVHEACKQGWLDIVQLLHEKVSYRLDVTNRDHQSPLHYCCQQGRTDIVKYLVQCGCKLNLKDKNGKEPFDYALDNGWTSIVCYLCKQCISSAMILSTDRMETTFKIVREMLQDDVSYWKTSDGDNILELVCHSKLITTHMAPKDILKLINDSHAIIQHYGGILPYAVGCDRFSVSCVSSNVMLEWLGDTRLDPMKLVMSCNWKTADGDTLLQLVCQSKSCISYISSKKMHMWLTSTIVDLYIEGLAWKTADSVPIIDLIHQLETKPYRVCSNDIPTAVIITPYRNTFDSCTSLQVIYQMYRWQILYIPYQMYTWQISSAEMLKWLEKTSVDLVKVVSHSKTADDVTLLQLICQSESCVSRIPSQILEYSFKSTNADILIPSLNWKTADSVSMIKIVQNVIKSQRYVFDIDEDLSETLTDVVITPHWESYNGSTMLRVLYQSELYISKLSSTSLFKWLQRTNIDIGRIVMPHWKTADGDTVLKLVCQSKSCVSRISSNVSPSDGLLDFVFHSEYLISQITSQVILNWLNSTKFILVGTVLSTWKTKNGNSIFKLFCTHSGLSHISSSLMLQWLNYVDEETFNIYIYIYILKSVHPDWTTSDGDAILHLLCKCSMKENEVVELLLYYYQQNILNPNLKDSDGNTAIHLVCKADNSKRAIVMFLVSNYTKLYINDKNKEGLLPLEMTKDPEIMERLIQHGAEVTSDVVFKIILSDKEHKASEMLLLSITKKTMLWKPTDVNGDGDTALHLACKADKPAVVTFLLTNMEWNLNVRDHTGLSALEMTKNPEIMEKLIQHGAKVTSDVVFKIILSVIEHKASEILLLSTTKKTMLWKPTDVNGDGDTALHLACKADKPAVVTFLLTNMEWNLNVRDHTGLSALEMTKNPEIMEKLIQHGAKVTSDVVFKIILSVIEHKASEILLLSTTKKTMLWKPTDVNGDGDTALHLACKVDKPDVVTFLLTNMEWNLNVRNHIGLSALEMTKNPDIILCICQYDSVEISSRVVKRWLNDAASIDNVKIVKIFDLLICQHKLKTCDGSTLLHLCCGRVDDFFRDTKTLVNRLLNQYHDPNYLDKNGQTPLQLTSDPQIMKTLVQHGAKVTSDVVFKIINGKEHNASEILLLSTTKKTMLWKPTDVNGDGNTALHLACKVDKHKAAKYLLKHGKCNATEKNLRNKLPLELTTNIDTISLLVEHGATMTPELVLKFVAIESIPNDRLAQLMWNPDITNCDGNTALHLACQADQPETVNLLLSQAYCDPNVRNNNEEVPLQMTTNSDIIKDLIRYGAQTRMMYESHKSALGTNEPIKPPVKMFIVGNPSVGKSTLTAALKKKLNFVARLFTSGKVSGVEKKTVGIIPHEIESDIFGRVTVYDFAGHREFFSGHAVLLRAAIQSTPPLFLLVVNLLNEENEIIQNILYWISFLENQCTLVSCKPHLIIVGSHADTLKSKGVSPQDKVNTLVSLLSSNYFINSKFIDFIPMDCQLYESTGMNDLRPLLVRSCSQLRIQESITFNAHCFLVYLLETFKETPAVTISTIHEQIEKQLLSHRKGILEFLPKSIRALYKICVELNERGHILFLRDKNNLDNSYVVIEEKSLLSEVSGTVFASEDFKQYKQLASNTGVVSLSKITECFPSKDINILIGFLTHLEFCHEISDQALLQLISEKYSPDCGERYYLFPALISLKAKDSVWEAKCNYKYHFGWKLQCTILEQFFKLVLAFYKYFY